MGRTPRTVAAAVLAALGFPLAASLPASGQETPPGIGARDFFKGKIVSFEGRRIEIAYDFSDPAQAEDWRAMWPFQKPTISGNWRVERNALRGDGNVAFRHRGVFDGEVGIQATLSSEDAKNFGAVVVSEESSTFTLFALADTSFTLMDRRAPLEHMVTTFLPAGTGPGGTTFWRYVETTYEPRIGTGPLEIVVKKKGPANLFRFAAAGRLGGKDVEATVGPRMAPAFYTMGSRVVVQKATISGVLDAAWLQKNNIDFEDRVPPDPDPIPGTGPGGESPIPAASDPAASKKPVDQGWMELVRTVSDPAKPKEEREAAADALVELKERRAVRPMIDLLYDEDDADPVGREVALKVFKGLVGKDCGYRPEAPRDYRLKTMPRIWEYWYAVREQIEKDEKKR